MKKINTVETIAIREQQIITAWYRSTLRVTVLLLLTLTGCTLITLAYQRFNNKTCAPRITKSNAQALQTKHAAQKIQHQQQDRMRKEKMLGTAQINNYATIIALHTEPTVAAQLLELHLQPTLLKVRYALAKQADVQTYIDRLRTASSIEKVRFESLEHSHTHAKNSACTLIAQWKKE